MTSTLRFNSIVKDRLFYNQFRYCVGFHLTEVSCLKHLDHAYVDTVLARRIEWRDLHQQRQQSGHRIAGFPSIHTRLALRPVITESTAQNLHELIDVLLASTDPHKLVASVDRAWVYTNNLSLMNQLNQMTALENKFYTEAIIDRPAGTIKLKRSAYQQRSYFKTLKMTAHQKHQLAQFVENQQAHIRVSPSLNEWLNDGYLRTQDYFFIDHSGDSWLVMLALVQPGIIRKTLAIITD